jgi:dTDP-4-amino-4,6-dideoxygalactose transaminase
MINITKTYLPDRLKFNDYINEIFKLGYITNNGKFVQELQKKLENYLSVENLLLVANGTLALQVAYKALELKGEVITSSFSFVATTSSLSWEGLEPVFSDIDPETFCMEPKSIVKAVSGKTSAIVPVHVFGNACEVEAIGDIAKEHNLKVIYDGAHAFGVRYKNKSLLSFGDATTLSFHATKLFHTIEGGAVIFKDKEVYKKAKDMINFGFNPDAGGLPDKIGINCKMNEFQAVMGLCVLDDIEYILSKRAGIHGIYVKELNGIVKFQEQNPFSARNYSYFPVLFKNERQALKIKEALKKNGIDARRYFYPSLDTLPYIKAKQIMPVSRSVSERILCLPLYDTLSEEDVFRIIKIVKDNI